MIGIGVDHISDNSVLLDVAARCIQDMRRLESTAIPPPWKPCAMGFVSNWSTAIRVSGCGGRAGGSAVAVPVAGLSATSVTDNTGEVGMGRGAGE